MKRPKHSRKLTENCTETKNKHHDGYVASRLNIHWSEFRLSYPIIHSVASGWPSCSNCRPLCTENVQYIRLITVRRFIIKVFYWHMKLLATTLKMFIFTINSSASRHVYVTTSNSRVAWSVWKFPPNCLQRLAQFNVLAEFTQGYWPNNFVNVGVVGGGRRRQQLTPAELTPV